MIRVLLSLTLRTYYSLTSPAPVEADAIECKVGGCCDNCQTSYTGLTSCIGCGGTSTGRCGDGQTYVPCPPDTCWSGAGKVNVYVTGAVSACD